MIQQDGDPQKCSRAPIYQRIPFLELCSPRPLPSGETGGRGGAGEGLVSWGPGPTHRCPHLVQGLKRLRQCLPHGP